MNDRYLFKAKHSLTSKKWHIGYLIKEPDGYYIRDVNEDVMVYISDSNTICQCTGLKDCNGTLIWENDIVRIGWQDNEARCEEIAQVAWDEFGYYPWLDEYHCDGCDLFNEVFYIEVIGNKFDNPELLKEQGE